MALRATLVLALETATLNCSHWLKLDPPFGDKPVINNVLLNGTRPKQK